MRVRLGAALASALTISVGLIVILGLLLPDNLDGAAGLADAMREMTAILLQIVTITVALTIIIGVFNLLTVHASRTARRGRGAIYSLVLLVSFLAVLIIYVVDPDESTVLLETVQFSVESALAGLVLFALVYGAYRMMHERVTWARLLFVVVLLVVLIGALPFTNADGFRTMRDWLLEIPVSAGARGLLIGIALATIVTGVRVLIGVDRSYRE